MISTTSAVAVTSDNNQSPAALILDDNTLSCPLPLGETTFIITLPNIAALERFGFINETVAAQGDLRLAVSNYRLNRDDPGWVPIQGSTRFRGKRPFNLSLIGLEAKYVKLSFRIQKEGRVAGIALYGTPTLENFAAHHALPARSAYTVASTRLINHPEDTLNFNFANRYARAHVAYVSSGSLTTAPRMIDDDVITSFRFSGHDAHPTVIIELAEDQTLHRVSAVYQMEEGQLDVYLLDHLQDNPGDLQGLKPIASVTDPRGDGKAAVNFEPHGARYVALRWTRAQSRAESFGVDEIGAFGVVPLSFFDISEVPATFADGTLHFTGDGPADFSNTLGTLADPPILGSPSP
jgi:hypothetical protein